MSQYSRFKLKEVQLFTVNKVFGYDWVEWNNETKEMKREKDWFQGAKKQYNLGVSVNGEQGYLNVSSNQLAYMFESVQKDGVSDLIGVQFTVKTNGKEGKDIRYFINPVRVGGMTAKIVRKEEDVIEDTDDEMPF